MDHPCHLPRKGKGKVVASPTPPVERSDDRHDTNSSNDQNDVTMLDIATLLRKSSISSVETVISTSSVKTVIKKYDSSSVYSQVHTSDSGYSSREENIYNAYPVHTTRSGSTTPTGPTRDYDSSRSGSTTPTGPTRNDVEQSNAPTSSSSFRRRRPESLGFVHPAFRSDPFSVSNGSISQPSVVAIPPSPSVENEKENRLRQRLSSMFIFGGTNDDQPKKKRGSVFGFVGRKDSAAVAPSGVADAAAPGKSKKRRMERIRHSIVDLPTKVKQLIGKKRGRDEVDDQEEEDDNQQPPAKAPTLARSSSSAMTQILIDSEMDDATESAHDAFSFVESVEISPLRPRPSILSFSSWETAEVRDAVNIASIADIGSLRPALMRRRSPSPPPPPDFTWAGDERNTFERYLEAASSF